ncbi:MAG TPA: hypothetical protein DIT32_05275 [Peptococcaceae bacterium]|nr:hypothetical protein [Peptococcaceae bacterium]
MRKQKRLHWPAIKNLIAVLNLSGNTKALFEYNGRSHRHYLICLCCKRIEAIAHCPLKDDEETLAKETDYRISGHKLVIYGYCPDCQNNKSEMIE